MLSTCIVFWNSLSGEWVSQMGNRVNVFYHIVCWMVYSGLCQTFNHTVVIVLR